MLRLHIPSVELWDEQNQEFIQTKEQTLQLEHSLVSLSKWESKWCKPFLSNKEMTEDETIDYIRCMTLTQNVPPETYKYIQDPQIKEVVDYIKAPMTATWFSDEKNKRRSKEIVTAELIYFWMFSLNIPLDCQKWHLNRLLTLIKVCDIKNAPPKKMSKRATASKYAALNAARRQQYNSKG
jgi:hypothetical protein